MKQSAIFGYKELFPGSDIVRRYTFKTVNTGDSYALLARLHRQLSQDFAGVTGKCALFQISSNAAAIKDCFECLSPHKVAA